MPNITLDGVTTGANVGVVCGTVGRSVTGGAEMWIDVQAMAIINNIYTKSHLCSESNYS